MTATLWINEETDETIELGGTFQLYKAFGEWAAVSGTWDVFVSKWPALSGLVSQVESQEDADPEWLSDLRQEASRFLHEHADELGDGPHGILTRLLPPPASAEQLPHLEERAP